MAITRWASVLVVTALAVGATAAATAAGPAPITVKGMQITVNERKGLYTMEGDLVGSWRTTAFTPNFQGSDGQFVGSGKELFTGCRDADRNGACDDGEPKGTIRFSFVYWATYDPKTQALVRGQCVHPVLGGTGAFAGVKGVIHMTDTPTGGAVRTTYRGTLVYGAPSTAAANSPATRSLAGRAAGPTCGG